MKIERVDDRTVKCFLSNEELEEYKIDYKDFITRSERAREVMREIIEQAETEVGYKPPRYAFDLQIMMVPDEGMVLTFSERDPAESGAQIIEKLQELKQFLLGQHQAFAQLGAQNQQTGAHQGQQAPGELGQPAKAERPRVGIFVFPAIGRIMELATALPENLRIRSALYQMGDCYYLVIDRGTASYEKFSRACIQAMEFGSIYGAGAEPLRLLEEHGECLIGEKALRKLRMR